MLLEPLLPVKDDETPPDHSGGVHSVQSLHERGFLPQVTQELLAVTHQYPVAITPALLDLIQPNVADDPIARQYFPCAEEAAPFQSARPDPIGDDSHSPLKGIIHRYPDRLLLNLHYACPAYCRFCFRKAKVGQKAGLLSERELERAIDYIREHTEIWEVILSGGEPLMLSPKRLQNVLSKLDAIAHVKVLRIHTRAPVTIPKHFTPELISILSSTARPLNLFLHCNHPQELGEKTRSVIKNLVHAGIQLFSQSVLLKGVNDDEATLEALMRAFVECRIKPHYLHHPDLVEGTRHFHIPLERGIDLVSNLRGRLSGLCQPTYILEIPDGAGKVRVLSDCVRRTAKGWVLTNYRGEFFDYNDAVYGNMSSILL